MRVLLFLALALPAVAQSADTATEAADLGTLAGVVTDSETGLPVMGAGVVIPALGIGAVSQRDGSYEITDVPPGTHAIRPGAFRYHLVTVEAVVAEDVLGGDETWLDIALRPGAAVGCEVLHTHIEDDHADPEDH